MFVGLVLVPVGVLIVGGERLGLVDLDGGAAQLVLMLPIAISGQVAAVAADRSVVFTTLGASLVLALGALLRPYPFDFAPWWVGILLAAGAGRAFRSSVLRQHELARAQSKLAQQTLRDERARIAREVHDIVAHTMSVTMLHLTAARLAMSNDPAGAEDALAEAERHGRSSMDDIRRVVRLLRTNESSLSAALPDDADVAVLVERYQAAGRQISLTEDGFIALSPAARLAVYRIVQEGLSNAVRHGTGRVELVIRHAPEETSISIDNAAGEGFPSRDGAGLVGMRERIGALEGSLSSGPDGAGGWRLRARIPA